MAYLGRKFVLDRIEWQRGQGALRRLGQHAQRAVMATHAEFVSAIKAAASDRGVPGVGLVGGACLRFEVAVTGPIVLGRNRHVGGGLFADTEGTGSTRGAERPSGSHR